MKTTCGCTLVCEVCFDDFVEDLEGMTQSFTFLKHQPESSRAQNKSVNPEFFLLVGNRPIWCCPFQIDSPSKIKHSNTNQQKKIKKVGSSKPQEMTFSRQMAWLSWTSSNISTSLASGLVLVGGSEEATNYELEVIHENGCNPW